MNYQKIYDQLVFKRQINRLTKNKSAENYQYCEEHHIVPRCLGRSDDESNLVNLTAREHFIAHVLLMKCHPTNYYLASAVKQMMIFSKFNPRNISSNSKKYDYIKKIISRIQSERQHNLKWIKNVRRNKTAFWPKDRPLEQSMVDDGWEFGRLPFDCHSSRTYENVGYQAGKYIRITNEIQDTYILKTEPIPDGWHRGMSEANKQHQSEACKGRKGTTTGRKCIINVKTQQTKYIDANAKLPDGWQYGTFSRGKTRSAEFKEKLSKILKGRKKSKETIEKYRQSQVGRKWYTNGIDSICVKNIIDVPNGYYPGRTINKKFDVKFSRK